MRPLRSALRVVATIVTLAAIPLLLGIGAAPVAAQSDGTVQTTSTLPTDNRPLGSSLPRPGQGKEAQSASDPGGWLQTSLFFLICAAILVIVGLVWRSSRAARQRRSAQGHDPVQMARARGEGVRPSTSDEPAASDAT